MFVIVTVLFEYVQIVILNRFELMYVEFENLVITYLDNESCS